jgi:hypothetical protein
MSPSCRDGLLLVNLVALYYQVLGKIKLKLIKD